MVWLRVKNAQGQYEMRQGPAVIPEHVEISQPPSVTLTLKKRLLCKLCSKRYSTPGVFAMHYQNAHKDLPQEKDEWRKHVENVEA